MMAAFPSFNVMRDVELPLVEAMNILGAHAANIADAAPPDRQDAPDREISPAEQMQLLGPFMSRG